MSIYKMLPRQRVGDTAGGGGQKYHKHQRPRKSAGRNCLLVTPESNAWSLTNMDCPSVRWTRATPTNTTKETGGGVGDDTRPRPYTRNLGNWGKLEQERWPTGKSKSISCPVPNGQPWNLKVLHTSDSTWTEQAIFTNTYMYAHTYNIS